MGVKLKSKSALTIKDNIHKSVLGICIASLMFLYVINGFFFSFRLFIVLVVYSIFYFLICKLVRFKETRKLFKFHYQIFAIPITVICTIYLIVYFSTNNSNLLSLFTICIYIWLVKYTKKRVGKKITIEIDDDGIKFAKFLLNEFKGLPKSLIVGIGIWAGTTRLELTDTIFPMYAIFMYCILVFIVYYTFFENKYCLENELIYI